MKPAIRLCQISDCHLFADPSSVGYGDVNPYESLYRVLAQVAHSAPDGVIVTGDISGDDSEQSYAHFLALMTKHLGNIPWWPPLQVYVVQLAEKHTPNAVDVASGLNIAAFNIGIALGSLIGGSIVSHLSLNDTTWIGAIIAFAALLLTFYSARLDKLESSAIAK